MSVLLVPQKKFPLANAPASRSLLNSFRHVSKSLPIKQAGKFNNPNVGDENKPQLKLRPSLPRPKTTVNNDRFIPELDTFRVNRMPPLKRRQRPTLMPLQSNSLASGFRKRRRKAKPVLPQAHKVRIAEPPTKTIRPLFQSKPTFTALQAPKPKPTFLSKKIVPLCDLTASMKKTVKFVSAPETISITEDLIFFLDCEDRKPLDDRHICENAPESDDEFDYNFDEFDTDFIDGEDEFIVTQPDGCPLRKRCRYLGVSWNTQHGLWLAQVGYRGKRHYVGQYHDCRMAALAIDRKCLALGIAPRNKELLRVLRPNALSASTIVGKKCKKVPNPNWQTRGKRYSKNVKRNSHYDVDYYDF